MTDRILVLPYGSRKLIHVSRTAIAENREDNGSRPVWTIHCDGAIIGASRLEILGRSEAVTGDPLETGSVAWVETDAAVFVVNPLARNDAAEERIARDARPDRWVVEKELAHA